MFRTRPRHEWLERLTAHDVPCAPVYDLHEVFSDPQVQHMELKTSMRRAGGASMATVRSPLEYSASPSSPPAAPPELGEHTPLILADLGYTAADVERLRAGGAISSEEEHHT